MATHSSILAWKVPRDVCGIQSMGSQRVGHDWTCIRNKNEHHYLRYSYFIFPRKVVTKSRAFLASDDTLRLRNDTNSLENAWQQFFPCPHRVAFAIAAKLAELWNFWHLSSSAYTSYQLYLFLIKSPFLHKGWYLFQWQNVCVVLCMPLGYHRQLFTF